MDLGRQSLSTLLLGASIFVLLGAYSLASGGEELTSGVLYVVAGAMMVYGGIAMYRQQA